MKLYLAIGIGVVFFMRAWIATDALRGMGHPGGSGGDWLVSLLVGGLVSIAAWRWLDPLLNPPPPPIDLGLSHPDPEDGRVAARNIRRGRS